MKKQFLISMGLTIFLGSLLAITPVLGSTNKGTVFAAVQCPDGSAAINDDASQCPGTQCKKGELFGLKPWYEYLPMNSDCSVNIHLVENDSAQTENLNRLWLIAMVIFEDLLRIAGLVAVGFIIYGGIRYITSQGEPEHTKKALATILNSVIGLAIAILGSALIAFIGRSLM